MKDFNVIRNASKFLLEYDNKPMVYEKQIVESHSKEIILLIENYLQANFEDYEFLDVGKEIQLTGYAPLGSPLRYVTHKVPKTL